MRNLWAWFAIGLSSGTLVAVLLREVRASESPAPDKRVKKIDDPAISGLKVPVPSSAETEVALVKREKELNERERKLKEQSEQIAVEEQRLKLRIDEYQKLQDDIVQMQNKNKEQNQVVLQRLVKTFESMSPKKAAGVIGAMSDTLAVDLFLAMKEKRVAAVLEVMDPSRAMTLSTLVAERRPAGKAIGEKTQAQ